MPERKLRFTREQIDAYAEASGDRNPIHVDEEFAKKVGLPGVIAHGMLQMGLLASLASEVAGDHRRLRRLGVRFAGMVRPGDEVTFLCEPEGTGHLRLGAVNQRDEPVLTKAGADLAN